MSINPSFLTLLLLLGLFYYVGRKLLPLRDLLLVAGAAGSVGFLLAGAFHGWALLVGLSFLVAESFYLGFVYRPEGRGWLAGLFELFLQIRAQAAFVMGIALVVFVVFAMHQGRKNVAALSEYIDIYEPRESIEWVPRVGDDVIGRWTLRTADPASSVLDYYRQAAVRDGWDVTSYAPPRFASLQKDGLRVTLMASDSKPGDTLVIIALSNASK